MSEMVAAWVTFVTKGDVEQFKQELDDLCRRYALDETHYTTDLQVSPAVVEDKLGVGEQVGSEEERVGEEND